MTKNFRKVSHSSKSDEWQTPSYILDLARKVYGEIELDPASTSEANKTVKATNYYSINYDGLACDWSYASTVWLNPPYSNTKKFVDKLLMEFEEHWFSALVLVRPAVETKWFQALASEHPVWFPDRRIKFINPLSDVKNSPPHGNALFCITNYLNIRMKFKEVFWEEGGLIMENAFNCY